MKMTESEKGDRGSDNARVASTKKMFFKRWRLAVLSGAFLLILINPFLNYFWHIDFIQGWYQSFGFGSMLRT